MSASAAASAPPAPTSTALERQREEFARRRFLAMPLAGAIAWALVALGGALLPPGLAAWALFLATGAIAWLGIALSRWTGEDFLDRSRPKNTFDGLFFATVAMALLAWAIAIPFFLVEPSSLPLSVGILTGMMWLPLSWIIRHWVGLFHALARTGLVLLAWYAWPGDRFVAVPLVIVAIYLVSIAVLEQRWRALQRDGAVATAA